MCQILSRQKIEGIKARPGTWSDDKQTSKAKSELKGALVMGERADHSLIDPRSLWPHPIFFSHGSNGLVDS